MSTGGELSERILVFAPVGRDGELLAQAATSNGMSALVCKTVETFGEAFRKGCGGALLTEEALFLDRDGGLSKAAEAQPAWSEIPFVVLTSRGQPDERVGLTFRLMQPLRNVTVLERPVRPATIVTALQAALRDRRRQYEVRDVLADLERRVEQRTSQLLAKITELEGFSYSVSHDMRTPLRSIVSNAAIVLEEEGERVSPEGRAGLERLQTSALKMARLIDDLLQFARLGTAEPRREPCDVTELSLQIADEVGADVEAAPGLAVKGDPRLLGIVLHNLIENACKYRPKERPSHIEVGEQDGAIFVRDDGIGFDMKYAPKLFVPFERLHRDGDYAGTGIGLANVKRIVERHGGRVWAESEPGKGSTFFFTLG